MVLDLRLPGMSRLRADRGGQGAARRCSALPIIVYTGKELTREEETELRRLAETIIVKDVRSPERLLDETALFLHRVEATLPRAQARDAAPARRERSGAGRQARCCVVDDDVRNLFASPRCSSSTR